MSKNPAKLLNKFAVVLNVLRCFGFGVPYVFFKLLYEGVSTGKISSLPCFWKR